MILKKLIAGALTSGVIMSLVPAAVMADSNGWEKGYAGWKYYKDGVYVCNDWVQDAGKWYFCYDTGYIISDVENYLIDGIFYSFDSSGACINPYAPKTKLRGFHDCNYVRTLTPVGELNYFSGTYYFQPDGQLARGWLELNGGWYYFDKSTAVMADFNNGKPYKIDGTNYFFTKEGVMVTGWYSDGERWVYSDASGKAYIEKWLCSGGKWYYFDETGCMISDCKYYEINGIEYDFDENGVCLNPYATSNSGHEPGWFSKKDKTNGTRWYFYDEDGSLHKGWLSKSGKWYYMDPDDGLMVTGDQRINGKEYYFDDSGEMITGWYENFNGWRYTRSDGSVTYDLWICENDNWYYVDSFGYLVYDCGNYSINEVDYDFDENGVCLNHDAEYEKFTGWHKRTVYGFVYWYYYDSDGYECIFEWVCDSGNWYYIGGDAKMVFSVSGYYIDGKYYDFDRNGICLNPYSGRDTEYDFS